MIRCTYPLNFTAGLFALQYPLHLLAHIDTHSVRLRVFVEPLCISTLLIPWEFQFQLPLLRPLTSVLTHSCTCNIVHAACFFHSLSGSRGFPGVVPLPIPSLDVNNMSNVLNFVFWGPVPEVFFFFFSQPVAGLTNRVPVWDSWARAPLPNSFKFSRCFGTRGSFFKNSERAQLPLPSPQNYYIW